MNHKPAMPYYINDVPVTLHNIAEFCVEFCGGGYNERQVSNAMVMNSEVCTLPPESSKEYTHEPTGRKYTFSTGKEVTP